MPSPSSASRSLWTIQVENVVKEPSSAVPESNSASPVTPAPCSTPSSERAEAVDDEDPEREGAGRPPLHRASERKRTQAPAPLTSADADPQSTHGASRRRLPAHEPLTAYAMSSPAAMLPQA